MKYYTQFHNWPYVHLIMMLGGFGCFFMVFVPQDSSGKIGIIVCGLFLLFASWILWRSRNHYLEITQDRISHYGFKQWGIEKSELKRVEHGKKSWVEEYDRYLKIHTHDQVYNVDSGFLINDKRLDEIVRMLENVTRNRA